MATESIKIDRGRAVGSIRRVIIMKHDLIHLQLHIRAKLHIGKKKFVIIATKDIVTSLDKTCF